jgi:hypothetical protein
MMMRNWRIGPWALLCIVLTVSSCQRSQDFSGKYQALDASGSPSSVLHLKPDGKGSWNVGQENVSFSWESRGEELLLHMKTGGVIVGKIDARDSILITLPGGEPFHFKRVME